MKFGIITDIHNNLTALKAITERLYQMECDKIICCGDMIGIGPCPEETVQYMMTIPNLIAVRGNHEKYLLEGMPTDYPNTENMSFAEMQHHQWEHQQLSAESVAFLRSLPYKVDMTCDDFRLSVMHYCMDRDGTYVYYTPNPSEDDLKSMFAEEKSDIILYGHNHSRNICKSDKLYVNVGSLGCPGKEKNSARAGILEINEGTAAVQTIDVCYDAQSVVDLIDKIHYPDADNIKKFFYGMW